MGKKTPELWPVRDIVSELRVGDRTLSVSLLDLSSVFSNLKNIQRFKSNTQ
jgi:hypothetical protein